MVLGQFFVLPAFLTEAPCVDFEHLAIAGYAECYGDALQPVADIEGHPERIGSCELGKGPQGCHCGYEEGDL